MLSLWLLLLFYILSVTSPVRGLNSEYVGCPDTSETNCGPLHNNNFCSGSGKAIFCDEAQGRCGNTARYRDAQISTKYDAVSIPKSCLNICSSGVFNPSRAMLIIAGWKIENMDSECQRNGTGWYGCAAPNKDGSVSFKFTGQGFATLKYTNCNGLGHIQVFYNGKELSDLNKRTEKTLGFRFKDAGLLVMKTRGCTCTVPVPFTLAHFPPHVSHNSFLHSS